MRGFLSCVRFQRDHLFVASSDASIGVFRFLSHREAQGVDPSFSPMPLRDVAF